MKGLKTYLTFLSRNKLFTVVNVAGLAISMMFILLIADMVTRQLTVDANVPDAERIYVFAAEDATLGHYQIGLRFQDRYPEIEDWCAYGNYNGSFICNLSDDQSISVSTAFVKKNFFEFFGYDVIYGNPNEILLSNNNVVLTRSAALRLFGSENPIGKNVKLDGIGETAYTVTGVVEDIDNSIFRGEIELFLPIENIKYANWSQDIEDTYMSNAGSAIVFFKYVKGFDPATKCDDMADYLKEIFWMYRMGIHESVQMIPMHDIYYSDVDTRGALNQYDFIKVIVFLIAGIIILLMAVSNYVSMSVAQTSYRAKEMATRRLLGSSKGSVFWRLILEALLLTVLASAIGLLLAKAAEPYAIELLGVKLDVIGDFNAVSIVCWSLFIMLLSFMSGVLPGSILSGYNPLDVVKGTFRRKTKMVYLRMLNVVQSGMTIALLACSIYLGIQIHEVLNAPLGYDYGNILVYPTQEFRALQAFRDEAKKLTFVKDVSFTQGTPLDGGNNLTTEIVSADSAKVFSFQIFNVDTAFINMFNIEITEDKQLAYNNEAVYLSENTFNDYKKLGLGTDKLDLKNRGVSVDIAGKFKDFKIRSLLNDEKHPLLFCLAPTDSIRPWNVLVDVIEVGNRDNYKKELDELYEKIVGTAIFDSEWYDNSMRENYRDVLNLNEIVLIFTVAALLISLLGLTAMNIYMISQRKRDISVRKVFGASSRGEQWRLMKFSFGSIVISLVIAIPLLIIGIQQIYDFVPFGDVNPWWIPIVAFIVVVAFSLLAVWFISINATHENPIENIKTE